MSGSADVDAYIAALSAARAARIGDIRSLVHEAYPDVAERIEWKMPVFSRGDRWVAAASQKSYVSLYLRNVEAAARIAASAPGLKHGKGCINIRDTVAMPLDAIRDGFREALA